jgi:hypothetical protein
MLALARQGTSLEGTILEPGNGCSARVRLRFLGFSPAFTLKCKYGWQQISVQDLVIEIYSLAEPPILFSHPRTENKSSSPHELVQCLDSNSAKPIMHLVRALSRSIFPWLGLIDDQLHFFLLIPFPAKKRKLQMCYMITSYTTLKASRRRLDVHQQSQHTALRLEMGKRH